MKTVKMMSALAALFMLLPVFVSCDKDDDKDDPKPGDINKITGTYSGPLGWKVMTTEDSFPGNYDITISPDRDKDDVTVVLPECSIIIPNTTRQHTIPSLTVNDVDVSVSGDVYTISEDDFKVKVGETEYTGSISGTISGRNAQLLYTLIPGTMPMPINFTFNGTLK